MLTTDQFNETRKRYKDFGRKQLDVSDHALLMIFMEAIRRDVYGLLDELEEAAAEITTCEEHEAAIYENYKDAMAACDKWKTHYERAANTLKSLGFTDLGGAYWKPPLGKRPDFDLIVRLKPRCEAMERALKQHAMCITCDRNSEGRCVPVAAGRICNEGSLYRFAAERFVPEEAKE